MRDFHLLIDVDKCIGYGCAKKDTFSFVPKIAAKFTSVNRP